MAQRPQRPIQQLSHSNTISNMNTIANKEEMEMQKIPPPLPQTQYTSQIEYSNSQGNNNMGNIISNGINNISKARLNIKFMKWITALFVATYMGFIVITLSTIDVIESKAMIVVSSVMASIVFMLHIQYLGRTKESKRTPDNEGDNLNWIDLGIYLSAAIFGMSELNIYIKDTLDTPTRTWVSILNITIWTILTICLMLSRLIHFRNIMEFAKKAIVIPQV